ncbi:MAG: DUF2802 domain-containing protein [Gammaproteobacteria bacterium]
MEIYSFNYDSITSLLNEIGLAFGASYEQSVLLFSVLVMLVSTFIVSRKVIKLEKTQFNEIDDITGFNRLIDEELGMLKLGQNELNKALNSVEKKSVTDEASSNDGKLFNNAPYTQAVQLARRGYAREDIISLCSLTESEAELILALHSNSKAA